MTGENISRKKFLEKSGWLLGGVTLTASGILKSAKAESDEEPIRLEVPKDKIRLGMIGTGQRYVEQIAPALKYLPNYEVIACADIIPKRLENGLKHSAPKAKGYKDYRKLLENKDIDAVVVCTPLKFHYEIACDVIQAGKHLVCEKPMTYTIDEAIKLERLALNNPKLAFRVPYDYRAITIHHEVKNIIEQGLLGKITHVEGRWDGFNNWRRKVIDPDFSELINWRLYRKYCGGLMTELLSHQIDLAHYMLDLPNPLKVVSSGSIRYWKDERTTYDNVHTVYEYPDGLLATFSANRASHYEGAYIKIYGEKATIEVNFGNNWQTATIMPNPKFREVNEAVDAITSATVVQTNDPNKKGIETFDDEFYSYKGFLHPFVIGSVFGYAHFSHMIVNGAEPDVSVTDGKRAAIIAHIANLSNRNHKVEYWKPEYDKGK
jgi:predicted dehydrogenase